LKKRGDDSRGNPGREQGKKTFRGGPGIKRLVRKRQERKASVCGRDTVKREQKRGGRTGNEGL